MLLIDQRYATKPIFTYNLLNQLEIIVMGDSYGVIRAFLLNGVSKHEENKNKTNLRNVVQDSNEWVAVLEARCHAVSITLEGYYPRSGRSGLASPASHRPVACQDCREGALLQPEGQCRVLGRCASLGSP